MVGQVLVGHARINLALQAFQVGMETIGIRQVFQVQPKPLNRVEKRAVFGQPDHQEVVFERCQSRQGCPTSVVGGIVHDQDEPLPGIDGKRQMLQKGNEGFAVFVVALLPGDVAGLPVISAEDMAVQRRAGGGNELTVSTFHPAAAQRRMQTQGRFVQEEELEVGNEAEGGVFFNQSSTCCVTACADGSCRALKSCLGCRQT